ncbi:permease [Engelhardtia mirabilis]|uniref:Putative permease n=1 Tax=Engelhardtia mirabilis TaxID=2528011 RepID=A0A518BEA3_9BACT|nr:putative permease [Planctomycetes bacterium Pla133]QDU99539.1 putative permease [Planctomycetes bacterium Pla86]
MFDRFASFCVHQLEQLGLLEAGSHLESAVHFFVMDVTKIFALLVMVMYAMGFLRALLSPERVRDYVRGKPRWLARALAIALGAVTPFCSCSSVPLFIGFVEAGIPVGVTFSFLIASPMINEVAVLVLAGTIGWKLTALYVAAGLAVAWVGGVLMELLHAERWVEGYVWKIQVGDAALPARPRGFADRHRFALGEVREILGRIWLWILIGVGVGALFHGFVPETWVAENLGRDSSLLSVPAAVLIGVPLYSNATGIVPVAEALLGKGVPIGTVLALMMSIAALSLPEMLILRKVVRWPALALYAAILTVALTLVGWTFNALT